MGNPCPARLHKYPRSTFVHGQVPGSGCAGLIGAVIHATRAPWLLPEGQRLGRSHPTPGRCCGNPGLRLLGFHEESSVWVSNPQLTTMRHWGWPHTRDPLLAVPGAPLPAGPTASRSPPGVTPGSARSMHHLGCGLWCLLCQGLPLWLGWHGGSFLGFSS